MNKISTLGIIVIFTSFFMISCGSNSKDSRQIEGNTSHLKKKDRTKGINVDYNLSSNSYNGEWCNIDYVSETGEIFKLSISTNQQGVIEASFYSGGPFEEFYIGKLSPEGKLNLYFDAVMGSMSFNNTVNASDLNSDLACKETRYAICEFIDHDEIRIKTFSNNCSYMPSNEQMVLKKLMENEGCWP